jgi:hypothetical protein
LWSRYDEIGHHFRRYEMPELTRRLEQTGFRIIETTSFNALLAALVVVFVRSLRSIKDETSVLDEFCASDSLATQMLAAVLALAICAGEAWCAWHAGGSRIFVAQQNRQGLQPQ